MPKSRKTPSQIGLEHHLRPGRTSAWVQPGGRASDWRDSAGVLPGSGTAELPTASPVSANCVAQMFLLPLGGKGWSKVSVPRPGDPVFVTRYSYLVCKNIICNTLQAI